MAKFQAFTQSFRADFLTPKARLAFTDLKQAFIKLLILCHFHLNYYIHIKTDISDYAIGEVFCQLTLNDSSEWYLVAFISKQIILVEI